MRKIPYGKSVDILVSKPVIAGHVIKGGSKKNLNAGGKKLERNPKN
jgi:hypothetical protein